MALLKHCEDSVSLKVEEVDELKQHLEAAQQELSLSKTKVFFSNDFFFLITTMSIPSF